MDRVVVGALVRDGQVLLAHRSPTKRAYPGRWELPGGVVEQGESEAVALVRELREELDVEVDPSSLVLLARVVGGPPDEPARISAWLAPQWRAEPRNAAPDEHLAIDWFGTDALPELAHPEVQAAVERQLLTGLRNPGDRA